MKTAIIDDQPTATVPQAADTCQMKSTTNDEDVHNQPGEVDELGPPMPPDGGWGWMVVFAAFFANLIIDGVCYTFGIIMPELIVEFGAGKGKTALVGSMLPGCYLLVGKSVIIFSNHIKSSALS